jgi:dihydrofolate synthase/folylpolyglutamate synthase
MDKEINLVDWLLSIPSPGKWDLRRMQKLIFLSGLDLSRLKFVHVTGTNGKGSVCAMVERIAREAGKKTGLYTSPHLVSVCERIQINGAPISEEKLIFLIKWAKPFIEKENASVFEALTLIGFKYFADERVDLAVVEVGLGGRLDATNVILDSLPVVTSISIDHAKELGSTLKEIAREKSAIIKGDVAVLGCEGEALSECLSHCKKPIIPKKVSEVVVSWDGTTFVCDGQKYFTKLIGPHQSKNASIAISVSKELGFSDEEIQKGLSLALWPGRFEVIRLNNRVVLDGAHNPGAAIALAETLKDLNWKPIVLFTAMKDKDYSKVISSLAPVVKGFIFTQIKNERCAKAENLKLFYPDSIVEPDFEKAFSLAMGEKDVLVAGSLFLVGEAKKVIWIKNKGLVRALT